ncbi:MAG: class I SAM-dependent methyltransferase [Phreatobacter sp.]|uniref:class I SAM-dependent methyltransferase n=1 Tax=Phreatobacter sp. TaxID=1966341 RepID=UPI00273565D1|nr:class I SAM-dependent methyltransferase [Phreatobacter sp.]MDP2801466.1 class I SAM-dependent methyltransferase [Phreatobacter sp.]
MDGDRSGHWEAVYSTKRESDVSWFQQDPATSLALMASAGATAASSVIDIGGGASRLVDALLARGYDDVTVLDLSAAALATVRRRLGPDGDSFQGIVADITTWRPRRRYDVWHDRAAFHFLTDAAERAAYVAALRAALPPDGHAVIATFALDGPERCSGLPVTRYDGESLAAVLGDDFERLETVAHSHVTPWGAPQSFQFSLFRRV